MSMSCRDCADHDGICPHSNKPCSPPKIFWIDPHEHSGKRGISSRRHTAWSKQPPTKKYGMPYIEVIEISAFDESLKKLKFLEKQVNEQINQLTQNVVNREKSDL